MVPIFLRGADGGKDYYREDFPQAFFELCKSHRKENRALAFAFILCDFNNAEVFKVLQDHDYWAALDNLSGEYLTIFSFHIAPETQRQQSADQPGMLRAEHRNAFTLANTFISELVHVQYKSGEAAVLFFQVEGAEVVGAHLVHLEASKVEESFNEIRALIKDVVESVSRVQPQFKGNSTEIFALITNTLDQRHLIGNAKRTLKAVGALKDLILSLFGKP